MKSLNLSGTDSSGSRTFSITVFKNSTVIGRKGGGTSGVAKMSRRAQLSAQSGSSIAVRLKCGIRYFSIGFTGGGGGASPSMVAVRDRIGRPKSSPDAGSGVSSMREPNGLPTVANSQRENGQEKEKEGAQGGSDGEDGESILLRGGTVFARARFSSLYSVV